MNSKLGLLRRLTADTRVLEEDELRTDSTRCLDSTQMADVRCGDRVTVFGKLKAVAYMPSQTVPTLRADLVDGTGAVTLVWLGRRRIPGIEPGRTLQAYGRLSETKDGLVMFNPRYELWA
ncbi:MAG: nucleic acid binding OB-fold tRNA/helicase-type [Pseudonocardiales bacterium]|nr:nucleic acid binding OB-fold tRNA/helicase-type [Jatrophihabitantaceae bacterium]MCW2604270.1 nucleic acid binding OB-fold tRNA/helicase-type [Pseudonocardiales bacterium]